MGMQAKSSGRYTEAQMKYFLEAAQAEQEFEMSAAFGSGVKVVNVLNLVVLKIIVNVIKKDNYVVINVHAKIVKILKMTL
jgi:hypothetical protein